MACTACSLSNRTLTHPSTAGPVDTYCEFGRGGPEPYYAAALDTYGPSISSVIGKVRDSRSAEDGALKGNLEKLRNQMYKTTAFAPELERTNSGDPLGLTIPRFHPDVETMAQDHVRQREERKLQVELVTAMQDREGVTAQNPPGLIGGSNHFVGTKAAEMAPFGVQRHLTSVPPGPVPCAW